MTRKSGKFCPYLTQLWPVARSRATTQQPSVPLMFTPYKKGHSELTPLSLMYCQCVGQFKRIHRFIDKLALAKSVLDSKLSSKFDLQLPGESLEFFIFVLTDDDADVAVSNVCFTFFNFRVYVAAALVDDVDHLIAVQEPLWAERFGDFPAPSLLLCDFAPLSAKLFLDSSIEGIYSLKAGSDGRQNLPILNLPCCAQSIFVLVPEERSVTAMVSHTWSAPGSSGRPLKWEASSTSSARSTTVCRRGTVSSA